MFGDYALLESEAVIFDKEICVQLYFHMWGGGIGKNCWPSNFVQFLFQGLMMRNCLQTVTTK